jgi:hypothetical protein
MVVIKNYILIAYLLTLGSELRNKERLGDEIRYYIVNGHNIIWLQDNAFIVNFSYV